MGKVLRTPGINKCIGCYSCMLACARVVHKSFSPSVSAIQIRSRGGLQSKLAAHICMGCLDPACAGACPAEALVARSGGGIKFFPEKCTGCRKCVDACVVKVIHFDEDTGKPVVCIQCGVCTKFCPHNVLAMEGREHA